METALESETGLCSNCVNGYDCAYHRSRGYDAIYCELFDILNQNDFENSLMNDLSLTDSNGTDSFQASNHKYKGLCSNCANLKTCKLNKQVEGVWHCEEYA
jgi:hypothetical protein